MQWMGTSEWLQNVKAVLLQEGFSGTMLQTVKPGQVFGLVRKDDNNVWQIHVRGFDDGSLEAEIEISNDYFEHLDDTFRGEATSELREILDAYHIPYELKGSLPQASVIYPPKQLTPWKPIVTIGAILTFMILLAQQKKRR